MNQLSQCIGVRTASVGSGIAVLLACCVAATPAWAANVPAPVVASTAWTVPIGHDPMPDPGLAPDDVVGIVLRALQHNDDPVADHGFAITFAFTSP